MSIALFQESVHAGVKPFTAEEIKRIHAYKIPGDYQASMSRRFPRKPVVDVGKWRRDHAARLRSLEKAAGL